MDKKECEECGLVFVDTGSGHCPRCGSTDLSDVERNCRAVAKHE